MKLKSILSVIAVLGISAAMNGCTGRGITISSLPEGAEVSINRRVVGRTPLRVGFNHYGKYRIEIRKHADPGKGDAAPTYYKTMVAVEDINPQWWGYDPIAAIPDNLIPARVQDEVFLHYALEPLPDPEMEAAKRLAAAAEEKGVKPEFDDLQKAAYSPLLNRALAARDGDVVHPLTKKEMRIEVGPGKLVQVTRPITPEEKKKLEEEAAKRREGKVSEEVTPPAEDRSEAIERWIKKDKKHPEEMLPYAPAKKKKDEKKEEQE